MKVLVGSTEVTESGYHGSFHTIVQNHLKTTFQTFVARKQPPKLESGKRHNNNLLDRQLHRFNNTPDLNQHSADPSFRANERDTTENGDSQTLFSRRFAINPQQNTPDFYQPLK